MIACLSLFSSLCHSNPNNLSTPYHNVLPILFTTLLISIQFIKVNSNVTNLSRFPQDSRVLDPLDPLNILNAGGVMANR